MRNLCLLVLPCLKVLLCIVLDSTGVAKCLLLLCSDIELNPGLMSNDQVKQFNDMHDLLEKLNSCYTRLEEGHASIKSDNKMKSPPKLKLKLILAICVTLWKAMLQLCQFCYFVLTI